LPAGQRARRPLSVCSRRLRHVLRIGARPSCPRGSGRDARSPSAADDLDMYCGSERGHLARGAAGQTPALRLRPTTCTCIADRSAAILPAGQRARRPLSVCSRRLAHALRIGARASCPRGSGPDARSPTATDDLHMHCGLERGHLARGAAGQTPALRLQPTTCTCIADRSAAILPAGQRARRPLSDCNRRLAHALRIGARPSCPRGSGPDARSPSAADDLDMYCGSERGHLARGAAGQTPALRLPPTT